MRLYNQDHKCLMKIDHYSMAYNQVAIYHG
jgi:hypothetical protein